MFFRKIKKFLNWSDASKPDISVDSELYEEFKFFRFPLIAIVLMLFSGTVGYIVFSDFSLSDALYQSGMTFTTVGFTEVSKITPSGRLFTVVFILTGFAVFTFSIGLVIESIKNGRLIKLIKEKNMIYKIARLKNHFVICYNNIYTIDLTKQFRQNHIPFVVIDNSDNFENIAIENKYPYYIVGEPHNEISLLKAHLSSAKGVISLSPNITDNIALITTVRLYEKELRRVTPYFIMSSTETESDANKLKKLGADSVVLPSRLTAQRLNAVSVRPDMENILDKFLYAKDSLIDIEEIEVPEYSWVRFKRLKETHLRELTNADVIGIMDENDKFIPMPNGDVIIGTKTRLLIVGTADGIRFAKKLIKQKYKPKENMYI